MLKDIKYQQKALKILTGMIKRDRLPSAILMVGQIGIGKRFGAINLAKVVNCLEPIDFDSCDKCLSCKKIDNGVHPDVHIIEPEDNEIKIESIRKIEEIISFKPFEGKKKIVIIDDAEKMNLNASNALLKTLEEPPDNTIMILISSNEDFLPDTIKSRCVKIGFNPLSLDDCKRVISSQFAPEYINFYLNLAMGRPGIVVKRNLLEEKKWFISLLKNMISDNAKESWADKEQIKLWLDLSYIFIRDIIVFEITGKKSDMLFVDDFKGKSLKKALDTYEELQRMGQLFEYNLNRAITWNYASAIMKSVLH